jgi:DMSO reductase anchor subunit
VQACPTSAISVTIVDVAEIIAATAVATEADADHALVPAAPPSKLTTPTTRYRSSSPLPSDVLPADHHAVAPSHAHPPLTVMLVLTQLAVGAFVVDLAVRRFGSPALADRVRSIDAVAALAVGVLAIGASTMHLGRPLYAWRAVIGLRHSWLSREIVAFGGFAAAAAAYSASLWLGAPNGASRALALVTAAFGVGGVVCSAQIYAVTGRRWWRLANLIPKFGATAAVTGTSLILVLAAIASLGRHDAGDLLGALAPLPFVVMVVTLAQLAAQATLFGHALDREMSELRRTALLLRGDLRRVAVARFACGVVGGGLLALILFANLSGPAPTAVAALVVATAMLVLTVMGELAERWLFFTASRPPRMPGGFR